MYCIYLAHYRAYIIINKYNKKSSVHVRVKNDFVINFNCFTYFQLIIFFSYTYETILSTFAFEPGMHVKNSAFILKCRKSPSMYVVD